MAYAIPGAQAMRPCGHSEWPCRQDAFSRNTSAGTRAPHEHCRTDARLGVAWRICRVRQRRPALDHEGLAGRPPVLRRTDRGSNRLGPAQLRRGFAGGLHRSHRELAAPPKILRMAVAMDGPGRSPVAVHDGNHTVLAGADDVRAWRAVGWDPRPARQARNGRPGGYRSAALAAGRSGRGTLDCSPLEDAAGATLYGLDRAAAHRPRHAAERSELGRSLSRPTPVDHPVS